MPEYVPLAFGLEAFFPPMALTANQLRELYNRLADPCRFPEYKQLGEGQGARLAENKNRHFTIGPDRLIYRDDFTQAAYPTFEEDVDQILSVTRDVFHIPVLIHSKVLIRFLMPAPGQRNSVEFINNTLIQQAQPYLDQFGRPLSGVGFRLVFPPTQEQHSTFHLRIEPYYRDLKMFFVENSAQFFDPVVNFSDIHKHLKDAYNFLNEKTGAFILSLSTSDSSE